jgi:predicted kinase
MNANVLCHMLIGPPGSGKTTLARQMHQAILNSSVISTDQIRKDLYGDETHQGQWVEIEAAIHQHVKNALELDQSIIYDATNAKRLWRMGLLRSLADLNLTWVGWHLTTPLDTCQKWNAQRDRAVPAPVIEQMYAALQQFPPQPAEGFAAVSNIDPAQGINAIQSKLGALNRSITNRANRTRHSDIQLHRYSTLLDFDRLMHLISLLVKYPGLGHLYDRDPEQLRDLLWGKKLSPSEPLDEICAVVAQQKGDLYADPREIAQDLAWLEENGLLSPTPTNAALTRPPYHHPTVNPHSYTDWDSFNRLLTTIRFIGHHPFCWNPEQSSSLKSLVSALQQQDLITGDRQAAVRKDIEQVLKPFGILPNFRMRRGYFLGSGILSERELLKAASLLQAQAKNIQDPAALAILETLQERLQRSQHDLEELYPVRAICNRTIINPEMLPTSASAKTPDKLEAEIEAGQLLELKRFAGVGRFDDQPNDFFRAWPLQIVFHNIAWYLGYEIADGPEAGLLQFERLDRLFRGRPQAQQRGLVAQRKALHRLQQLYQACGGLYLGTSAQAQQQFLSHDENIHAAAALHLELWLTDPIFSFVSEGTQRFPLGQMKMSPKLTGNSSKLNALFSLPKSDDPQYPNRLRVELPSWSKDDRDLRRWILGFGSAVKVISPPEMVYQIHDIGCAIAELYNPAETLA